METVATQERIVEQAAELFKRYGIRSVTMDDLASHLSMSKKTIYQFFKDKKEVVTEIHNVNGKSYWIGSLI